ncbi:hypothetical protein OEZ85_010877 [Tetradesmus obliquus]|uniref:Homologous recombination OB-fold protein OB-fold domain-containing protein n=1 Tax=Tetradesmus obliquus TaxID=3088 RepID=A0ABY8TQQ1_TETOB|nr:hypothetical protein OEZ85_010877 [Tetradesmus obliquus]
MSVRSGSQMSGSQRGGGLNVPQVARILPGPAGKLQQLAAAGALQQATPEALGLRDCGSTSSSTADNTFSLDVCFQSAVWCSAHEFTVQQEARAGTGSQLHTIKLAKGVALGKVPQMLVMLSSFQPSGTNSAFAKVKDPTGSMGAALHSSVLQQQAALGPGCVLLLQQVSVFTPAPGTTYAAVTARNIVRVSI